MDTADAVVVGGGIAGVSVAYELAAHGSVLLVEAERSLAMHSTGRSAAAYLPSYGGPVVRALTAASGPLFAAFPSTLDTPTLLTPRPLLWVACDERGERGVAALLADGVAEPLDVSQASAMCPVLRADALRAVAVDRTAMDIDAMALHQGYVRGLRARGGRIATAGPVTAVRRDGVGWRVLAGEVEIATPVVVDAAGAWADRVAALAGVAPIGLRPLRRTIAVVSATAPVAPDWPLVADVDEGFYFRPEGGRVLVSPADETPSEPTDTRPVDLDVALAIDRVNEVSTLGLRSVHAAWAGLRSFVDDRVPVAGSWPDAPGFVFLAGQGGYGIQIAPALARVAAAVALGHPPPADLAPAAAELSPTRGRAERAMPAARDGVPAPRTI